MHLTASQEGKHVGKTAVGVRLLRSGSRKAWATQFWLRVYRLSDCSGPQDGSVLNGDGVTPSPHLLQSLWELAYRAPPRSWLIAMAQAEWVNIMNSVTINQTNRHLSF